MQQPPSLPPLPLPPPTTSSSFLYFSSSPSLPTYLLPSFLLPPPFSLLLPPPAGGQRRGSDPESIGARSRLRVARCDDPPSALTSRGNRQKTLIITLATPRASPMIGLPLSPRLQFRFHSPKAVEIRLRLAGDPLRPRGARPSRPRRPSCAASSEV